MITYKVETFAIYNTFYYCLPIFIL